MAQEKSANWVTYNTLTRTYNTPDGTSIAAELANNVHCLADVLHIAQIRAEQRAQLIANNPLTQGDQVA